MATKLEGNGSFVTVTSMHSGFRNVSEHVGIGAAPIVQRSVSKGVPMDLSVAVLFILCDLLY